MIPWIIWFAIYGLWNALSGRPLIEHQNGIIAGILVGPSVHLWYLPYIFLALVSFDRLRCYVQGRNLAIVSAALTILAFVFVPHWRQTSMLLGYPWAQYAHALPGLLIGAFFLNYRELPAHTAKFLAVLMLIAACSRIPYPGIGTPYAIGICAGYAIANHSIAHASFFPIAAWGRNAFGVYLIHILILRVILKVNIIQGALVPIVTFVLSMIIIASVRRALPRAARYVF